MEEGPTFKINSFTRMKYGIGENRPHFFWGLFEGRMKLVSFMPIKQSQMIPPEIQTRD